MKKLDKLGKIYYIYYNLSELLKMSKNPSASWLAETHKVVREKGTVNSADKQLIKEKMLIENDEASIEDITFKNYHYYF
jgi:5'(3')-deoxyribonucleotidase